MMQTAHLVRVGKGPALQLLHCGIVMLSAPSPATASKQRAAYKILYTVPLNTDTA